MKKTPIFIAVSVVLASLLCLVSCSSENKYTIDEAGLTISLPDGWEEWEEDSSQDSSTYIDFAYGDADDSDSSSAEFIFVNFTSGFEGVNITDYSIEYITSLYDSSVSIDDISQVELSSGTYYCIKGYGDDDDHPYVEYYATIENDCFLNFTYVGLNEDNPHFSDFEDMVNNAEYEDISLDESDSSVDSANNSGQDSNSSDEDTSKKYTDEEVGFSVTLPSEWTDIDVDEVKEEFDGYDNLIMVFKSGFGEGIECYSYSGFEGHNITDFPLEFEADTLSTSVDNVSQVELSSGTYYRSEYIYQSSSGDDTYVVGYSIVKNGYLIHYQYRSVESDTPGNGLSDFEDMVNNAEY